MTAIGLFCFGAAPLSKIAQLQSPRAHSFNQMCNGFLGGVVSRDGLGLGRIGAPGYRAHRSVAMAPMFKGIRFGRHHICSEV